jgi:hypothetical protein
MEKESATARIRVLSVHVNMNMMGKVIWFICESAMIKGCPPWPPAEPGGYHTRGLPHPAPGGKPAHAHIARVMLRAIALLRQEVKQNPSPVLGSISGPTTHAGRKNRTHNPRLCVHQGPQPTLKVSQNQIHNPLKAGLN